jgi:hypothetical protein
MKLRMASLINRGIKEKTVQLALIKFIKGVYDLISFLIQFLYFLFHQWVDVTKLVWWSSTQCHSPVYYLLESLGA